MQREIYILKGFLIPKLAFQIKDLDRGHVMYTGTRMDTDTFKPLSKRQTMEISCIDSVASVRCRPIVMIWRELIHPDYFH